MGCKVSSYRVGGGMTSSTISLNFNDTAEKTVFTATEKCILKLSIASDRSTNYDEATFKLNSTNIGTYGAYYPKFEYVSTSLANILSPMKLASAGDNESTALILYLEEGDTVYATRASNRAFEVTLYSAVFTF